MKKYIMLLLLVFISVTLSGCSKKTINSDKFTEVLNNYGCDINDLSINYENETDVDFMYKAYCEGFNIDFYILDSNDTAIKLFNNNYSLFKKEKTGTNFEKDYKGSNYNVYSLTCSGMFRYISRIDNTLIYTFTEDEYKSDIVKIMDDLGY